jgi:hypothetical protein
MLQTLPAHRGAAPPAPIPENVAHLGGITSRDIRLRNARHLVSQAGGMSAFADRLGTTRQYVFKIVGAQEPAPIGSQTARRIEQAFELPEGWLDVMHEHEEDDGRPNLLEAAQRFLYIAEIVDRYIPAHERTLWDYGRQTLEDSVNRQLAVQGPAAAG